MEGRRTLSGLQYKVEDNPPWITTVFLAFQHYLMLLSSNLATPGLVAITICARGDVEVASILLGNMLFACGICTVIQFFFGVRLPIVQCPQYAYVVPAIVLTSFDEWKCPDISASSNKSNVVITNFTLGNLTDSKEEPYWQQRLNMITGSLMVASVFEIVLGASGILTVLLRFIGPLTVAPTIMMMGLGVLQPGYELAGSHWGIAFGTMAMIVMLSECIPKFKVSLPCQFILTAKQDTCTKKEKHKKTEIVAHKMFSVIISVSFMWLLCYILTITDVFPDSEDRYGYHARTDVRDNQLKTAPWFSFPYPGKFGMPTFNSGLLIAFIGGVFTSTIESIGDYYTCARIAGAVPPPPSAVNRGILIEGIDCIVAAAVGAGFGVTSCSQNIGAISLTKVGSRRVVLVAGILMMIFGCFNKFSTLMVTIPDPIVGASFIVLFGVLAAVGASNLQYVDLNSTRNMVVFGISLFMGFALPIWTQQNEVIFKQGDGNGKQVLLALLGNSMFMACFTALLLDNVIPGTDQERGILSWRELTKEHLDDKENFSLRTYDLPFGMSKIKSWSWARYIPFSPTFTGDKCGPCTCTKSTGSTGEKQDIILSDNCVQV
ncbi:solute carrier family 23 member 2-like [Mytilus californianus]|uniref:solute carrier family 23 member 2-like n=1 Tax=Mytilus californianus TaxID=6549 RepID=UPI002247D291|nr:solute carrier family 23 member 2-like [Mytilus californianus]